MIDIEEWKPLDHLGHSSYAVSSYGNVKSLITNKRLKTRLDLSGFMSIRIGIKTEKKQNILINKLVSSTFLEAPQSPKNAWLDYIDGDKTNDNKNNLRWVTRKEQIANIHRRETTKNAVLQYNKEGIFIRRWNSIYSVIDENPSYCYENISACCRKQKRTRSVAYSSRWKYEITELENEEWRKLSLPSLNDVYVSNRGRIKHTIDGTPTYGTKARGYRVIGMSDKVLKISKRKSVHQLVATAFLGTEEGRPFVNHKNGNKEDNDIENLEWVTNAENVRHANETGLCNPHKRYKGILKINKDSGEIVTVYESVKHAAMAQKKNSSCVVDACKRGIRWGHLWVYATHPDYQAKLSAFKSTVYENI